MIISHGFRCGNTTPCRIRCFNCIQVQQLDGCVSVDCRLDRTGSHLPLAEIRSELAEKAVFHAAAQHMDHRIMRPGASLQIFQRPAVFQRQALINAAENGTRRFRDMLSGFAAVRLNTLRNISGRCENRVVRVDITGRLVPWSRSLQSCSSHPAGRIPGGTPGAATAR